ncbi:MAG: class I SAM-dependent methyltransferase [Myxococcota bacterium]
MELPESALGVPLSIQRVPLCPELRLQLVSAEANLDAPLASLWDLPSAPYWAFCWGAGQALARHLLDHPERVRGARVVDFGAGSGVAAIAAARAGAHQVVAVDVDPLAHAACRVNAALNGVDLGTRFDLPDDWDVLLAADVLYEPYNLPRLEAWAAPGRRTLMAVPERAGTPRVSWPLLARVNARTHPDVDPPVDTTRIHTSP